MTYGSDVLFISSAKYYIEHCISTIWYIWSNFVVFISYDL